MSTPRTWQRDLQDGTPSTSQLDNLLDVTLARSHLCGKSNPVVIAGPN
jgi:hypothetical protein